MNKVRKFFAAYESGVNSFDPDLVSSQFVSSFMGADPNGVSCYRNDESLRQAMLLRRDFFTQLGFKFAEILSIADAPLDEHYTMAKVHWRMIFEKVKGQPQEFKFLITYFLYDSPDGLRIAFFIAREDEEQVLREAGLLPLKAESRAGRHVIFH